MGKTLHLTFASSISDITERNSSFDAGILRVAYTGGNRNGSYISKETYESCLDSIYNCPIVCRYDRESDSLGSHDIDIVKDADGNMRIVNITEPVGVVPESAKPYWETVTEDSGTEHEYLCTEVLLWKRQEAYKKIKSDGISSESMEISVKSGRLDDGTGLFVIDNFEFTGFCLLGDDVEPCFESASLEVFSNAGFKSQMAEMMRDLKETFSKSTEGGTALKDVVVTDEFIPAASEDNLDTDQTKFDLSSNICDSLSTMVEQLAESETPFGTCPRYLFIDYDATKGEVYCYDTEDSWNIYGFQYSTSGDNVSIDQESKKRMKYAIVDFDNGTQVSPIAQVFESAGQRYTATNEEWQKKYTAAEAKINELNGQLTELNELREFKRNTEVASAKAACDAVFAKFSDLDGIEAFEALKNDCGDISADALEEKCFAIRGRNMAQLHFNKKEPQTKIPVEPKADVKPEPYGGIVERFCKNVG